jgi:hypothetical protein
MHKRGEYHVHVVSDVYAFSLLPPKCENNGRFAERCFPEYRLHGCQAMQNMRNWAGSNLVSSRQIQLNFFLGAA